MDIDSAPVGKWIELEDLIYSGVKFSQNDDGYTFSLTVRSRARTVYPMANRSYVKYWKTLDGAKRHCKAKFAQK